MTLALTGARIFDGARMLDGHAVVIENGRIAALPAEKDLGRVERRPRRGAAGAGLHRRAGERRRRRALQRRAQRRGHPRHRAGASRLWHDRPAADPHHRHPRDDGGSGRRHARGARRRRSRRARHPSRRPVPQPRAQGRARSRLHAPDRGGGHRHHDLAEAGPHAGDPGAGAQRLDAHRAAGGGRRDRLRRPHRGRLRDGDGGAAATACAASRISSTRCRRSPAASPARSARRSTAGIRGAASSSTCIT